MVKVNSSMVELGAQAPDFTLVNTIDDKMYSLVDLVSDTATVIMFICNHCPFVLHVQDELVRIANDYQEKGVSFIAISANDISQYPADSPGKMKAVALEKSYPFPYLYDETQSVAKAYDAQCTPDFFIYDDQRKLVYRGQLDDSRPGNDIPVTGKDIRAALDNMLAGRPVADEQKASIGCNIKWV